MTEAPVDPAHGFKAAQTLAQTEAFLLVLEGAIEFQFIVEKPAEYEMNLSQPLVVAEPLGDRLDLFEYAKALLIPALHPHHLHLGEAEVDPLLLPLVGFRETIQAIDDRSAVSQRLGRGEPCCRPLGRA